MNNNSKRKTRPSGGGGGGGASGGISRYNANDNSLRPANNKSGAGGNGAGAGGPAATRPVAQGVYNNTFFMHSATALVGSVVEVVLRSGNIYEGVFRTFSGNFDIALELPACIKSKNLPEEGKVPKHIIFPADTVVKIVAKDFDSQYATAGAFQTDGAISDKCNGARPDEKELEPWDSGANGDIDIELDGAANGWDANEMFRKNEHTFGVTSTFDDSLATYTIPLDKGDSLEFKEAEAKAEKLAAEIENNPTCRDRLDLENGDEEALFAAVERPEQDHRRDGDRERERNDREREREDRDRDRDRDRGNKPPRGAADFQLRETMSSDRYITKQTRGPQMSHVGMSQGGGGGGGRDRDNGLMMPGVITGGAGQGGATQSAAVLLLAGGLKTSGPASSANAAGMDASGKYSMVKRKTVPQGGKVMRGNVPPSSGGNISAVQGGNGNPVGQSKGGFQPTMVMQNQYVYQGNSQIIHGSSQYRNPSHMSGGPSKLNGDSNANTNKPLPQRQIRQYQGSQSNSLNYGGEPQPMGKPMHSSHGGHPGQNSNSPPLQTGGQPQQQQQQPPPQQQQQQQHQNMAQQGQPQPQPQRQMRSRDNQLQDLRQFGQDFQLAPTNNSPPQQQPQQQQQQVQAQVQQQQQQRALLQSTSPPQQQQQQQHVPMQHQVPPAHLHQAPLSQPHYVPQQQQQPPPPQQQQQQHVPLHLQQKAQQPPQQQQQQLVEAQHQLVPKQHQQPPAQQQQPQLAPEPSQPQPIYHPMPPPQTSPVVITSPVLLEAPPPQILTAQQPQQQLTATPKPEASPAPGSNTTTPTGIASTPTTASASSAGSEKSTPAAATSVATSGTAAAAAAGATGAAAAAAATGGSGSTPVVKKHVLNPSAKPFTPRAGAGTPNPSRPHTPQTPVPMQGIYTTTGAHVPAAAANQPIFVVQQQHPFPQPTHPQAGQPQRLRRNNYAPMGAPQMHVSATTATGQPLMAAAPMPFIPYSHAPQTHFQSQGYTHMPMRLYPEQQQLQFLTQTPQSTTPSPGQTHQTFHPPPQPSPAGGGPQPAYTPPTQQTYQFMCLHPQHVIPNPYYQPHPTPQHAQQNPQYQIVMQQHHAQ
ncbi:ataxin-2 homolog [Drosophila madeirensis]|uniref:Ataxin-2 homolog n=1 Tax=Drosophila madeirensis TaxID=30013 RepID=A0AAU9F943_DROMD